MATIESDSVVASLTALGKKFGSEGRITVIVGYTQEYAIYVHENLEAFHSVGQAKYLEVPFRLRAPGAKDRVMARIAAGATLRDALLVEGLELQRDSQLLCPVDTGALKNSAFTRVEGE